MPFLLDSNGFIVLASGSSPKFEKRLLQVAQRGHVIYASSIVLFELRYGAFGSADPNRNH